MLFSSSRAIPSWRYSRYAVSTASELRANAGAAQALELRRHLGRRQRRELPRHGLCLTLQLDQHLIDRLLPEVDAAFERGVDLDVEPGFDRPRQELHRNRVDDQPRQDRERGEA